MNGSQYNFLLIDSITMDIEWTKPVETYGDLTGYLVKYGKRGQKLTEILITDKDVQHQQISNLEKGIEYEFRWALFYY